MASKVSSTTQSSIVAPTKSSKTLIIGGNSKNGQAVIRGLIEAKENVVAAVRNINKIPEDLKHIPVVTFDFEKSETFADSLKGVSKIFYIVPFQSNLYELDKGLVDAIINSNVEFVVRLSAIGANPSDSLGVIKLHGMADDYLMKKCNEKKTVNYCILQPNFFFQNLFGQGIKQASVVSGSSGGDAKASWIDIRDIADVAVRVLVNPKPHQNKIYVLTGGEAISDKDICALLTKHIKPVSFNALTVEAQKQILLSYKMSEWMADSITGLEQVKKNGQAAMISPVVKEIVGKYRTIEDFIKENAAIFK